MNGFQRPGMDAQSLWRATFVFTLMFASPVGASVPDRANQQGAVLQVDGLSASVGEDNPRVLYILPWQAPTLPRRPRVSLQAEFPDLTGPSDPGALERYRVFRNTLDPLILSPVEGFDQPTR